MFTKDKEIKKGFFRFKQFEVSQQRAAMKIGTDGVLLGAWASLHGGEKHILDIGTGTGVIALMLAQRTASDPQVRIEAVESETEAAHEAAENFARSPWSEKLTVRENTFQEFASQPTLEKYDLIVSNPPYFMAGGDFRHGADPKAKEPSPARIAARHAEMLPYDELIAGVVSLLSPEGRFAAIFPYRESGIFIAKAAVAGLYCNRLTEVRPLPHKPVKRVLVECSLTRSPNGPLTESFSIGDSGGYTEKYRELTRDFYLFF